LAGALAALLAGLALGAAMRPDLTGDERLTGPPTLGEPEARPTPPADNSLRYASFVPAGYSSQPYPR
jgi:hypothetical protein